MFADRLARTPTSVESVVASYRRPSANVLRFNSAVPAASAVVAATPSTPDYAARPDCDRQLKLCYTPRLMIAGLLLFVGLMLVAGLVSGIGDHFAIRKRRH